MRVYISQWGVTKQVYAIVKDGEDVLDAFFRSCDRRGMRLASYRRVGYEMLDSMVVVATDRDGERHTFTLTWNAEQYRWRGDR